MSTIGSKTSVVLSVIAMWTLPACGSSDPNGDAANGAENVPAATAPTTSAPAAAPGGDAAPGAAPAPLVTGPVGTWVWNDVPGAVCGYGQQTGIGVSLGSGSDVLIYLEGGGACWDELTCEAALPPITGLSSTPIVAASYFTNGFTGATFDEILSRGGYSTGIFDRTLPNNPFKNSSVIYVPYCTGDLHSGSATAWFELAQKTAHFAGAQNLELSLSLIASSFPSASRVTLSGSSAGGYGALLNFDRVHKAFGGKRVDLISDSGPVFANNPLLGQGFGPWNTKAVLPAGCPQCLQSYEHIYSYLSTTYPASRLAFLSHDEDEVISLGNLMLPYPTFYFAMKDFSLHTIGPNPNWRYFVSAGTAHTTLYDLREPSIQKAHVCAAWLFGTCLVWDPLDQVEVSRTVLADWLTQMVTDDPTWTSKTSINQ